MPKCVTQKQRLANAQNAQKSTGPKTPQGKTKSSRNALKHGLLAKNVVIHCENQADFDALLADLCNEIQPRTLIEETLVERIATGYWRLRRAQRLEAGAIRATLETPDPSAPDLEKLRKKLQYAEGSLRLEARLYELLNKPADQLTPAENSELERSAADFAKVNFVKGLEPPALKARMLEHLPNILNKLQTEFDTLRAQLQTAEKQEALRLDRRPYLAALPDRDTLLKVVHYENMLDRQIHRALAELRRSRKVTYRGTERRNAKR